MTTINDQMSNDQALELIEASLRDIPACDCGELTQPVDRGGVIWLECASLGTHRGALRRLFTLDFAATHVRRLILDASELATAA
jgi:hypothetical protein